jgi:hypothetical protein
MKVTKCVSSIPRSQGPVLVGIESHGIDALVSNARKVLGNFNDSGEVSCDTWNVAEQFLLAATAQNLKRLVRFLAQREAQERSTT